MRAGAQTVTLLGIPRTILVLRSLADRSKGGLELRRDAGSPAQSTMRNHLAGLEAAGTITRRKRDSFPGALEYALTDPGRDLLAVAESLEQWLADSPQGGLELGSDQAKAAVKGLAESWLATVLTTLATEPMSLTELDKRITAVSYPTIERCLENMRLADQLEVGTRGRNGTPHTITDWLRRGVAPLILAAYWEHRHRPTGADPVDRADIDGALRLVGPLFRTSRRLTGSCQMELKVPRGDAGAQEHIFGVIEVQGGELSFDGFYPEIEPDVRASGSVDTWFSTVVDANTTGLELNGDLDFGNAVIGGLRRSLFKGVEKKGPDHSPHRSLTS